MENQASNCIRPMEHDVRLNGVSNAEHFVEELVYGRLYQEPARLAKE